MLPPGRRVFEVYGSHGRVYGRQNCVTMEPEAELGEDELTPEEANIRWLLAAVLHHDVEDSDAPGQPGGGEIDSSRNGGSQPAKP